MKRNILLLAGTIFIVLALASCGGGGGGGDGDTTDTTPPTVVSTVPGSNGTGAAVNSAITATFSEAMDASTISDTTFLLEIASDRGVDSLAERSVIGTVAYSASSLAATFTPTENLSYGTWYRATITTGATDTAGNALAQNYVWDFQSGLNPDSTAPTVVSTSPEDGDTRVRINTTISAEFSEDLDPSTVSQSTFYLGNVSYVDGTVSYADRTVTFTPTLPLNTGTEYEAQVGWEATDLAGNDAELESWTFTTSRWNLESKIEDTGMPCEFCDVAANDDGYAMAAWIRIENEYTVSDHTHYTGTVFTSLYVPSGDYWTDPVAISSSNDAAEARVAIDPLGNAIVIWAQTMIDEDYWGYFEQIYAKKYQIAYGWIGETELTTGSDLSVKEPEVAMHTNGYAMMVWNQETGGEVREIYCKRYVYSDIELWPDGIGDEEIVSDHDTEWGYAYKPDVAFDPFGDVMVTWYQDKTIDTENDAQSVNAIFHDWSENSWGEAPIEIAEVAVGTSINQPRCASDTDGDFAVVWTQDDVDDGNEREDVWFSAHLVGDSPVEWQGPDRVSGVSGTLDTEQPRVVLVPTSNDAFVAWDEYTSDYSVNTSKARRYSEAADNWLPEVDLFPDWGMNSNPQIVMDEAGIVSVIAAGYTGSLAAPILSMLATRYMPTEGWGETEVITDEYDYSEFSRWGLAVDSDGNLHAVCSLAADDDLSVYVLKYFK